jgi:ribosomal protein S17E
MKVLTYVLAFALGSFIFTAFNLKWENGRLQNLNKQQWKELSKEYQSQYIYDFDHNKNYDVISLDNGKTWYLINKSRKIVGDFDKLYPGLRKRIKDRSDAWNALADYAKENDPIGSKPITEEEIKLLNKTGIEVRRK